MRNRYLCLAFLLTLIFLMDLSVKGQPAQVPKSNSTKVYMHYMPWFDAPHNPVAGQNYSWGWHWTMNNKNPNIVDGSGRRQVASHYYPIIGAYASSDPHVVEYHLLLMKLSGIDGVLMDWYGSEGSNGDVGNLLNNSNALIDRTDEVGIKFGLIIEDRFWGNIQNARNSMAYARNNYFNRSHFIRHGAGNDPLVGVFGPITHQTPGAWADILSHAGEDVEFLPLWYENADAGASADGEYAWIYSDAITGLRNFYQNRAPGLKTAMGVAYPGFNDYYVQGGAGQSYFFIPENNVGTLNDALNTYDQFKSNLDFLQLATWNDFGEGTIFEPTVENGYKFLVRIQQYTGVPYNENDLKNVHRLFTLRKKYLNDAGKQSQLNTAFNHFVALRLSDAVAVMNSVDGGTPPPPPPPTTHSIPGTVQAEAFASMNGIQTENTTDAGGGQNVGYIDANDWMDYNVNVSTAGTYTVSFRVASGSAGGQLQLRRGTTTLATANITGSGGWQNWTTITATASLSAGTQTLRLHSVSGGYNVNWVGFATTTTPPPPPPTTHAIPGTVQAEAFSGMNGIQMENTSDAGGGQNVGWIDANDWLDYNVNVSTAGTYNVSFRVASGASGGQMQLRKGTTVLATANISGTGGWQNWTTVTATTSLTAGTQTLRLHAVSGGYNLNYVQFSTGTTPPPPPPPSSAYYIKNRWQNTYLYDAGDRVRYNTTRSGTTYQWQLVDVGSGQRELRNVGTGEYMHVENLTGYIQCTARTAGWGSARWTTEDAGSGFVRLKNAWQSTHYIHVENLAGHAQHGTINTAWMSAQWLLEAVPSGGRISTEEAYTEDSSDESAEVWPTIVDETLYVKTDGSYHSLVVVDLLGRIQYQDNTLAGKNSMVVDVKNLDKGLLLVKLKGVTKGKVFRISKQ
jgi:hypothetical protein